MFEPDSVLMEPGRILLNPLLENNKKAPDFLRGPFLIFNEKRSKTYDNACFVTGCGGTIQSVLYGFAGLRIGNKPDGFKELLPDLYIKPCLPPKWKKLEIKNLQWRGKSYDLVVSQGNKWELKNR